MRQLDGLFWPDSDVNARKALVDRVSEDVDVLLRNVTGRRLVIQAGGNVGVYPLELKKHFETVWTFEPDPDNFGCLWENVGGKPGIMMMQGALGEEHTRMDVENPEPGNCGCVRLVDGQAVWVVPLDSFPVAGLDALWLDVEGVELAVLKGAAKTIERYHPVVMFENKGHHRHYGVADGEIEAWLTEQGYRYADRSGNDEVWTHG